MIGDDLVPDMIQHAASDPTAEVCGLVVRSPSGLRLIRGVNMSPNPRTSFDLGEDTWLDLAAEDEAVAVYHSHVLDGPTPSMADLDMCEASGMPWHIVTCGGGHYSWAPTGYQSPLIGRPYAYLVHDCYTLVRDYYRRNYGIVLPEFDRPDCFWDKGLNIIEESFEKAGFVRMPPDAQLEVGDVLLIKIAARLTNHCAVYVGDGKILHHMARRLSKEDPYGGQWQKHTVHHVRHVDRIA